MALKPFHLEVNFLQFVNQFILLLRIEG
ncbi:MAG: hypothetical protein RLY18_1101, partial [Pseudomonadota bacterium]